MTTDRRGGAASRATISAAAAHVIRQHAVETFPHECCGALIAVDGIIAEAFPLANTTGEEATRRFTIGPDGYRFAEARAREVSGMLAGFYHSHPNQPARPSAYDLEHAWPNLAYVIISVTAGTAGDIRCWHLRDDRRGFDEAGITWADGF
jgi:proteasome lid subunit RPN8/RPN11